MKIRTLKKFLCVTGLILSMLAVSACGGEQIPDTKPVEVSEQDTIASDAVDAEQNLADIGADTTAQTPESDDSELEEAPIPTDVTVTMDEFYGDTRLAMRFLGLKQYDRLDGESFTDTPEDGMQYLVLFLQIENRTEKEDYFNAELLNVTLDGNEITNSYLINDPEGYPTIFTNIQGEEKANGFIVWQVPEDWQKLELTYHGWEGNDNVTVYATLTPDDLKNPPAFEEVE